MLPLSLTTSVRPLIIPLFLTFLLLIRPKQTIAKDTESRTITIEASTTRTISNLPLGAYRIYHIPPKSFPIPSPTSATPNPGPSGSSKIPTKTNEVILIVTVRILTNSSVGIWGGDLMVRAGIGNDAELSLRKTGRPSWSDKWNCSQWAPCPLIPEENDKRVFVDWKGFYGRRDVHRVVVYGNNEQVRKNGQGVKVLVSNYNRGRWNKGKSPTDGLKEVQVRFDVGGKKGGKGDCGGWERVCGGDEKGVCKGVGETDHSGDDNDREKCECKDGWSGRFCESKVVGLKTENASDGKEGQWPKLLARIENATEFGQQKFFEYKVPSVGTGKDISVALILSLRKEGPGVGEGMQMVVKKSGERANQFLEGSPILPSSNDVEFQARKQYGRENVISFVKTVTKLEKDDLLMIMVVNNGSKHIKRRNGDVSFEVFAFPCDAADFSPCPTTHPSLTRLYALIVPISLGALTVFSVTVGILLWADRRARRSATCRDRLSRKELCVMAPAFVYTSGPRGLQHPSGNGVDESGGAQLENNVEGGNNDEQTGCSICLSEFENGDTLRRLRCTHCFHAECLDPWMISNATCPTCREPARIDELSERRPLRHLRRQLLDRWDRRITHQRRQGLDDEEALR